MPKEEAPSKVKGRGGAKAAQAKGAAENQTSPPAEESKLLLLEEKLRQQNEYVESCKASEEKLRSETSKLREDMRKLEREHIQVTKTLRSDLETAALTGAALREEVTRGRQRAVEVVKEASNQQEQLKINAEREKVSLKEHAAALQTRLDALEEFRARRDQLEAETQQAKQENERLTAQYEEKLGELHLRAHRLGEKVEQLEREAAEQAAAAGAVDESDADPLRLLQQNRKLAASLRRTGEETEKAKRKAVEAQTSATELRAALKLSSELERKAVEDSVRQGKKTAQVEAQVAALAEQISVLEASKLEDKVVQDGLRTRLAAVQAKAESLRNQIKRQAREVRHARQVARDAMAERSEAQAFLVSSIRMVRREIASQQDNAGGKQWKSSRARDVGSLGRQPLGKATSDMGNSNRSGENNAAASSSCSSTFFSSPASPCSDTTASCSSTPSLSSAKSTALAAAASLRGRLAETGGRLADIGELAWEEREAVLRLLLAQINNTSGAPVAHSAFASLDAYTGAENLSPSSADGNRPSTAATTDELFDEDEGSLPELGSPNLPLF